MSLVQKWDLATVFKQAHKAPGALCPQTIISAHKITYALLLVYATGYRILRALSIFKDIALYSDSVG